MNSIEIDLVQEKNKIIFVPDNLESSDKWKKELSVVGFDWDIDVCTSLPILKDSLRESDACVLVYHLNSFSLKEGQELLKDIQHYRVRDQRAIYVIVVYDIYDGDVMVECLNNGADDFLFHPHNVHELGARINVGLRGNLLQSRLTNLNLQLRLEAQRDALTGLCNRGYGYKLLQRELDLVKRGNQELSVVLADLDYFKQINDNYGHLVGDEALKIVSKVFADGVRTYDSVVRWGGEEFLIIVPHGSQKQAVALCERLRNLLRGYFENNTFSSPFTCSFGVFNIKEKQELVTETVLSRADEAMYAAKANGRDQVEVWEAKA